LHLCFSLSPSPSFRLDLTVWGIRHRPENLVDQRDGKTYSRVWAICGRPVLTSVTQSGGVNAPQLEVTASLTTVARNEVTTALERFLGLRADFEDFLPARGGAPPPARTCLAVPGSQAALVSHSLGRSCQRHSLPAVQPESGDSPAEPPSSSLWIAVWEGRSTARVPHAERSVGGHAEVSPTPSLAKRWAVRFGTSLAPETGAA
jgi:hypothetical protein